jgi:hypothetical protein
MVFVETSEDIEIDSIVVIRNVADSMEDGDLYKSVEVGKSVIEDGASALFADARTVDEVVLPVMLVVAGSD